MDLKDAIILVDNVCAQMNLSREAHERVKEAIKIIRDILPKEKE